MKDESKQDSKQPPPETAIFIATDDGEYYRLDERDLAPFRIRPKSEVIQKLDELTQQGVACLSADVSSTEKRQAAGTWWGGLTQICARSIHYLNLTVIRPVKVIGKQPATTPESE